MFCISNGFAGVAILPVGVPTAPISLAENELEVFSTTVEAAGTRVTCNLSGDNGDGNLVRTRGELLLISFCIVL